MRRIPTRTIPTRTIPTRTGERHQPNRPHEGGQDLQVGAYPLAGARPPFSLERLSILADGRVAYLLRKPRRNGATPRKGFTVSVGSRVRLIEAIPLATVAFCVEN